MFDVCVLLVFAVCVDPHPCLFIVKRLGLEVSRSGCRIWHWFRSIDKSEKLLGVEHNLHTVRPCHVIVCVEFRHLDFSLEDRFLVRSVRDVVRC